jgi:hypothetical protein
MGAAPKLWGFEWPKPVVVVVQGLDDGDTGHHGDRSGSGVRWRLLTFHTQLHKHTELSM